MLSFSVGNLLHKPEGSREDFAINGHINFEEGDGIKLSENITAEVRLLKLPHEINVQVRNLRARPQCLCSRCLKPFIIEIIIPAAEREFIIDLPKHALEEGEDVYYINKNTAKIELDGMFREEILLHFPEVAVCSESCKGLCDKCGANLNETTCLCIRDPDERNSPFKLLAL